MEPICFRSLPYIQFVAVAFQSEEFGEGTLIDLFLANCPALDPPLGGVCRKAYTQVRDYEYFISIKFREHQSSGSVGKADYVFQYIYMH